ILANLVYMFTDSAPVTKTSGINVVYSFIQDIFNVILGARDSSDAFGDFIPDNDGTQPITDLLQNSVISGGSVKPSDSCKYNASNNAGLTGTLFGRIAENSLAGERYTKNSRTITDTVLPGVSYLITAVNSFVPSFIPQLLQHTFSSPTAEFSPQSIESFTLGSDNLSGKTTLDITNKSTGLNRAYLENGEIKQTSRYFIKVNSVTMDDSSISVNASSAGIIAGGETASLSVSGSPSTAGIKTATINYDIVDKNGDAFTNSDGSEISSFKNQTFDAYLYITNEVDWYTVTYTRSDSGLAMFDAAYEIDDESQSMNYSSSTGLSSYVATKTSAGTGKNSKLNVLYPAQIIIDSSDTDTWSNITMRVRNTGNILQGSQNMDSPYLYDPTYTGNGDAITGSAIAATDSEGNLINYMQTDYYINANGGFWIQEDQLDSNGVYTDTDGNQYVPTDTRPHVVYTKEQCESGQAQYVSGYHLVTDDNGNVQYATISYDWELNGVISWGTPINGVYIALNNGNDNYISISYNKSSYFKWLMCYDSEIPSGDYTVNVGVGNDSGHTGFQIDIKIRNTDEKSTLESEISSGNQFISNYAASDLSDYSNGSSAAYSSIQNAIKNALRIYGTPLSLSSVDSFAYSSKYQNYAATSTTSVEYGDPAYTQVTSSYADFPSSEVRYASNVNEFGETTGETYYYADENCTIPYYTNIPVAVTSSSFDTSKYVYRDADGKIATSYKDGLTAYVKNAAEYEYAWDTTTYDAPYYGATDVATGNYYAIQFVYRNASGVKVASYDDWAYKLPEQVSSAIPNTPGTENRSGYQMESDTINYLIYEANKLINSNAALRIVEEVSNDRANLNENNFDKVTYQLMVNVAKSAESLISSSYESKFVRITTDSEEYSVAETYDFYLASEDINKSEPIATTTYPLFISNLRAGEYEAQGLSASATTSDFVFGYTAPVTDADGNIDYQYATTASGLTISEAIRTYNFYKSLVIHRGYEDNNLALAQEILCATGDTFDYGYDKTGLVNHIFGKFDSTVADYDESGNVVSGSDSVTFTDSAMTPKYGTLSNGLLQNVAENGKQIYTTESWNNYIRFLAQAINISNNAETMNGYSQGFYDSSADYKIEVTDVNTVRTNLMIAENELTPYVPEVTVIYYTYASGKVVETTDGSTPA
ncbi:MAG: hypothetical protein LIO43_00190, partial [Clostridiales bacterium]|nr:hypothetical protein [Clostridiales bacterium]